jgi:hypothetical protein
MAQITNTLTAKDARLMTEVTQSALQLDGVTSRWLLKVLPWVDVTAGVYQVNRTVYDGKTYDAVSEHSCCDDDAVLPKTAARPLDYQRQYELHVVQTILQLQTRAVDLFNEPHDQTSMQVQLTIEALREKQEYEMVNNTGFGLLYSADPKQRITPYDHRPTPDALDNLLTRRPKTRFLFANPKTIAAIGRECNKRGLVISNIPVGDSLAPSWRGVPLLSCSKIPIVDGKSSIIAMRTGEDDEGVIGLRPKILPDQCEPGVNVRFMGISDQGIISYLVSSYFSVAVLTPNALGILENVEIEHLD